LWAVIDADLHAIKLIVPHIFYVNQKMPKEGEGASKMQFVCFNLYMSVSYMNNL